LGGLIVGVVLRARLPEVRDGPKELSRRRLKRRFRGFIERQEGLAVFHTPLSARSGEPVGGFDEAKVRRNSGLPEA
jgi:hypothetical protein